MRNAFIEELVEAASTNERIALVVGDLGYGVVEPFANRFPRRFFNAGVAEQNMMGLSAGLASEGYHVFVYSIANFPTFRCAEQIRNDVDYHQLPVTIVTVGGGVAYGNLGYSHHAVQDYALMRTMPNMLIAAPGDPMEVRACMRYLVLNPQPSYLRLGKAGEKCIHESVPSVEPGKWLHLKGDGRNNACLTTGATLDLIIDLCGEHKNMDWAVFSMPMWSMKTKDLQKEQLGKFKKISTFEDHLVDGGFGSWLLESASTDKHALSSLNINGLSYKVCGMVGRQSALHSLGGLSIEKLGDLNSNWENK